MRHENETKNIITARRKNSTKKKTRKAKKKIIRSDNAAKPNQVIKMRFHENVFNVLCLIKLTWSWPKNVQILKIKSRKCKFSK